MVWGYPWEAETFDVTNERKGLGINLPNVEKGDLVLNVALCDRGRPRMTASQIPKLVFLDGPVRTLISLLQVGSS